MNTGDRPRYAVYFVPDPRTALWRFGCAAIGYDALTGDEVPLLPDPVFGDPRAREWTEEARRYGFHATLKAPFVLAAARSEGELLTAANQFAASRRSFSVPRLAVARLDGFIALTLADASTHVSDLAADCVRGFEPFRAPLSATDRARRLRAPLTPRQRDYLDQWGYPYVFDEFRFHMTLTGSLPAEDSGPLERALRLAHGTIDGPVEFDGLAIFKQTSRAGRFRVIQRFEFANR